MSAQIVRVTDDYLRIINDHEITFRASSDLGQLSVGPIDIEFCCQPLLVQASYMIVRLPIPQYENEADLLPLKIGITASDGSVHDCAHVRHDSGEGYVQLRLQDDVEYLLVASH